jgi:catechol 2,3-dioxygenase
MDSTIENWPLRRVGLRVQDMAHELEYYTHLGLSVVRDGRKEGGDGTVGLGAGGREVLTLRTVQGGRARPPRTAGLYHFALLVPSDEELGSFLQYLLEQRIPLDGASDHLVSQALYLSDPEGNGIEVYVDRPREQWPAPQPGLGRVGMATLPLNAPLLLKQAHPFSGFSEGLRLGHMHLNVGNLERCMEFYQQNLGMELMVDLGHSADFLSWDGYHHHLGINVWAGRNAQPEAPDMYGLDFFELKRPGLAGATLQDPDGVTVRIIE